jgi:serine phosphatase RsbU (regulator of sigma subunit)
MIDAAPLILLVEDDDGDALLIQECLTEAGIAGDHVRWRRSLAAGTAALVDAPGCVLLDLGLPDAEGLQSLTALVAAAPDTPIIVLTGRHDSTGIHAVAAGAQDYLVKDDLTGDLLDRSIRYAMERKRAERTSRQLREARLQAAENARLERGLLPTPLLRSGIVQCATYYQPGLDHAVLGGDFFDVVETEDGRIRAVIGDVMGHGPDQAALGVHLRVAWRTLVLAGTRDHQVLAGLSQLFDAESGGSGGFVTACDVTIHPDGTTAVRVAGHPAPLVCVEGKTTYLETEVGPPLGISLGLGARWSDTGGWPETRSDLPAGSSVVLYTDGLLDAYAPAEQATGLGIEELIDATDACAAHGEGASTWIPTVIGSAPTRSVDDTAIVVITRTGAAASAAG